MTDPETGETSEESSFNPIYIMADSGARGSTAADAPARRHARSDGQAVRRDHRDARSPRTSARVSACSQYFISTHGARKGLADTALKTANSGYLTRRLVDVAQDAVVTEFDCGTLDGIRVTKLEEAGEVIQPLGDRILGRVVLEDVVDPLTGEIIVDANTELDEALVRAIEDAGIEEVVIRSVLTCQTRRGVCAHVLRPRPGARLPRQHRRGRRHHRGAVDRRAGHAAHDAHVPHRWRGGARQDRAELARDAHRRHRPPPQRPARAASRTARVVVMNRHGELVVMDDTGREREHHRLVYGAVLKAEDGERVHAGADRRRVGSVRVADPHRGRRHRAVRRSRRRRHRHREGGRGHGSFPQDRDRVARGGSPARASPSSIRRRASR